MIVGRGVTTCLICDKNGVHVVNNMATVLGIKLLFDTDEYKTLLMGASICTKCTGRLHQLFDFEFQVNIRSTHMDLRAVDPLNDVVQCKFCSNSVGVTSDEFELELETAVSQTKWRAWLRTPDDDRFQAQCCYACFNYLLLYNEVETTLKQEHSNFFKTLNSWKVELKSIGDVSRYSHWQDALKPNNKLPNELDSNENDTEQVDQEKAKDFVVSEEIIRKIRFQKRVSIKPGDNCAVKQNEAAAIKLSLSKRCGKPTQKGNQKRKSKSSILKDSCDTAQLDGSIDKFTFIKLRRSSSTPFHKSTKEHGTKSVPIEQTKEGNLMNEISSTSEFFPTEKPIEKSDEINEGTKVKEAAISVPVTIIDLTQQSDESNELTKKKEAAILVPVSNNDLDQHNNELNEATMPDGTMVSIPLSNLNIDNCFVSDDEDQNADVFLPVFEELPLETETCTNRNEHESVEAVAVYDPHTNGHIDVDSLEVAGELAPAFDFDDIIEYAPETNEELGLPLDAQLNFDQSETVQRSLNYETAPANASNQSSIKNSFHDYTRQYNTKDCHVRLDIIDHETLRKILGKRAPAVPKVTKSGRISKPKRIVDLGPLPSVKRKTKKAKTKPILYFEEDFPHSLEIEEVYVDYTTDYLNTNSTQSNGASVTSKLSETIECNGSEFPRISSIPEKVQKDFPLDPLDFLAVEI